ncbi:MAG: DUF350 domain-containing protein [Ignavibacteriaceae bacterium]|jgi:uncharacterized membrane protein YjfL (UPF0719 family)
MDIILLITGLVQILLSLFLGILFVYSASKVFQRLIRGINEIEELKNNNVAVAILNGAIVLAIIIVVKNSIETAITIFSNTLRNPEAVLMTYVKTAFLMLGHIVLGGIIAFVAVYVALLIFMRLTKDLDELKEIKGNNIAVSIFLSVIIISIALLLEPGLRTLLDALIPFPPVSFIDIGG